MLNVIQTNSHYLSNVKINKILKNDSDELYEKISFSENINFKVVTNEILTNNIFNNIKVILVNDKNNSFIKELLDKRNLKLLKNIIDSENYLFIITNIINSKTITKKINENKVNNYILNKNNNVILNEFINDYLLINKISYKLSKNETYNIIKFCENNIDLIVDIIDKSIIEGKKNITDTISIIKNQSKNIEDNPYIIFDVLENRNFKKIKEIINEYYIKPINIVGILNLLFTNYKEMYQIDVLSKLGINNYLISKELSIHPYRIKKLKNINNYSKKELEKILSLIINSEINIKEGGDPYIVLKSLLTKIMYINK